MDQNGWIVRKNYKDEDLEDIDISVLREKFKCSEILIKLLINRGYIKNEDIATYLNPSLKSLHEQKTLNKLPNIKEAVARLKHAYSKSQKIIIYGDYDTDGLISTSILYNFLKAAGFEADYHIPDRFDEGYDINIGFLKKTVIQKNYKLLICVDCGTNSFEVKNFIKSGNTGVDVIVCDHHEPVKTESPESGCASYLVINPKLKGSRYPFKFLSGAGVTFKFIIAALREFDNEVKNKFPKSYLRDMIDLVAISTVADVMPLVGENRIIVKEGLKTLLNTKHAGLKKIISQVLGKKPGGNQGKITTYDIGFLISPRLNASGRITNAKDSICLLIHDREDEAGKTQAMADTRIKKLEALNSKRRVIQDKIFNEIKNNNDFDDIVKRRKIFIGSSCDWHEGVLGIVASDIVKEFNIPAILFKEHEGILKGSGRSIANFDLYKNLEAFKSYFLKFGGHSQACGITMEKDKFDIFKSEFRNPENLCLRNLDIEKKYYYDMEIRFDDISNELIKDIEKMEPFGIENTKPLFLATDCMVFSSPNFTGNEKHLLLKLKNSGRILDAVIFNYFRNPCKKQGIIKKDSTVDILFNVNITNQGNIQLIIKCFSLQLNHQASVW